jgi:hypothetical protein
VRESNVKTGERVVKRNREEDDRKYGVKSVKYDCKELRIRS